MLAHRIVMNRQNEVSREKSSFRCANKNTQCGSLGKKDRNKVGRGGGRRAEPGALWVWTLSGGAAGELKAPALLVVSKEHLGGGR